MGRWIRVIAVGLVLGLGANWYLRTRLFAPRPPDEAVLGVTVADVATALEEVATGLEVPWEMAFLEGGDFLITERPGRLTRLSADGRRRWTTEVPGVRHRGEGGLLGLALDPGFDENGRIYLYLTGEEANRVERWVLADDGALSDGAVVVDAIPAAAFHNGGRLAVGPDGMLWATTGDAGNRPTARDPTSLSGKILRTTLDGGVPEDNPSGSRVWSLGHRNPQGLAWDDRGRLWSTEHGRSGVTSGLDEVNLVVPGGDYGWPEYQGNDDGAGVRPPVLHSGADHTWAPSGAAWLNGRLFFGGLRGQALYEVRGLGGGTDTPGPNEAATRAVDAPPAAVDPTAMDPVGAHPELVVHFFGELGRIRQVQVGPDGMLYLLTGNRDGRGQPRDGDDRLLRLDPAALGG